MTSSGSREPRPFRRRARRYQGADWTPSSMSADVGEGEWCGRCKKRHGYKTLRIKYEVRKGIGWVLMWLCPKYLHVVGELHLKKPSQASEGEHHDGQERD